MRKIFVLSQKHIGDIFFDSIILDAVQNCNKKLNFCILVNKKYIEVSEQIQQVIESDIKILPLEETNSIKKIIELSPLERSFYQLINLIKFKIFKDFSFYFFKRDRKISKGLINAKVVFLKIQEVICFLLRNKILNKNLLKPNYIVNGIKTFHILDQLLFVAANEFDIPYEEIKKNLLKKNKFIRLKYLQSKSTNNILFVPSVGEKNGKSKKALNSQIINDVIKKNNIKKNNIKITNFSKKYIHNLNKLNKYNTTFNNIFELISQMSKSKEIYCADAFPSHLAFYLGFNVKVFFPGYHFGMFFPYPNWFNVSSESMYLYDFKNINNFLCCSFCKKCQSTTEWERIFKESYNKL